MVSTGEVACADDASAREVVALSLAPQETAELWEGIRHVGKITGAELPVANSSSKSISRT